MGIDFAWNRLKLMVGIGNFHLNICMGSVSYSGMSAEVVYTFTV
jgi:hypothetical protein